MEKIIITLEEQEARTLMVMLTAITLGLKMSDNAQAEASDLADEIIDQNPGLIKETPFLPGVER